MNILIVAKTRQGERICISGLTEKGHCARFLTASERGTHPEYEVGEVWAIDFAPNTNPLATHIENAVVLRSERLRLSNKLESAIRRYLPPATGEPIRLFDGGVQVQSSGHLFVSLQDKVPPCSLAFWVSDRPLQLVGHNERTYYRYPTEDGGHLLAYAGIQEPADTIPASTLLAVTLAPRETARHEERRYLQLSGWMAQPKPVAARSAAAPPGTNASTLSASPLLDRARAVLKQTFGFADFLPVQSEVVARVMDRRDTLVIMPTGGGKSLCYQLPALLFNGLTVVVSPLIALMQDQVTQLRQLDIPAAFLNTALERQEYLQVMSRVRSGQVRILYVAPETLLKPEILLLLEECRLVCFAIDEAHCISEWGHDFRPEYRQIQNARRRFPDAVCVALTATATTRVREDIRDLLAIDGAGEFVASFNRPNLFLTAAPRHDGLAQILSFLEQHRNQSGIIYCSRQKGVEELAAALNANGWSALPYHAGLSTEVRRQNQDRFIRDHVPIMVATLAFGMGINKSNVRFVVHHNLPRDIESYYQEIGRAGRDGLPADCLLLHHRGDAMTIRHFIEEGAASEQAGRHARLNALMRLAETQECRRVPLLAYFGERFAGACGSCDNCRPGSEPVEKKDVTDSARKLLLCVQQTGEVFGPAHVIAVLRGSRSERVLARQHDRLGSYGSGKELTAEAARELARQLIQAGLLEQDLEFGGLKLTNSGRAVLSGNETVRVPVSATKAAPAGGERPLDDELFLQLRKLRRQLADGAGVPPYVVFSDRALTEMATCFPQTPEQFREMSGVGDAKLAHYGAAFLQTIREYCEPRGLLPKTESPLPAPPRIVRPTIRRRCHEVGALFGEGRSLDEIAAHFGVQPQTVVTHLQDFQSAGGRVDPQRLLASSELDNCQRDAVLAAFEQLGTDRLAPVHEALGGQINYGELHLLRLYLTASQASPVTAVVETLAAEKQSGPGNVSSPGPG